MKALNLKNRCQLFQNKFLKLRKTTLNTPIFSAECTSQFYLESKQPLVMKISTFGTNSQIWVVKKMKRNPHKRLEGKIHSSYLTCVMIASKKQPYLTFPCLDNLSSEAIFLIFSIFLIIFDSTFVPTAKDIHRIPLTSSRVFRKISFSSVNN